MRRALAFDEPLRRIGDADAADDERDQSHQRQKLAETFEIAGKVGGDVERERVSHPASGKARASPSARRVGPRHRRGASPLRPETPGRPADQ